MKKILILIALFCLCFGSELDEFESEFAVDNNTDEFYSYNKFMTNVNGTIYKYSVIPLANTYEFIVPKVVRKGISNFLHNASSPLRFTTLFLSGKFKEGSYELFTFIGNTLVGWGGIFRPYKYERKSDFGLMLARWGVPAGSHLVLPVYGPSNIRDTLCIPFNYLLSPDLYLSKGVKIGYDAAYILNVSSENKTLINTAYDGINPYPLIRDFYEQNRKDLE